MADPGRIGYGPAATAREGAPVAVFKDDFKERKEAAANARKALLARFKAAPGPDDPGYQERQAELKRVAEAREARIAERRAAMAAEEARKAEEARAAAAAAAVAAAEAAARARALAAEQKAARDARYAARKARKR
jgi:hypothetical protein